jgi:hypothetical protein
MVLTVTMGCSASSSSSNVSAPDGAAACPTGDSLTQADLPQGKPCAPTSAVCDFLASMSCAVNGWECACKQELWDCAITSKGGGACVPDSGARMFLDASEAAVSNDATILLADGASEAGSSDSDSARDP